MDSVLLVINDSPYYDNQVTKEGEDSQNPDTGLKSFVFHEVIAAREFIDWGIARNSFDGLLGVATKYEAI